MQGPLPPCEQLGAVQLGGSRRTQQSRFRTSCPHNKSTDYCRTYSFQLVVMTKLRNGQQENRDYVAGRDRIFPLSQHPDRLRGSSVLFNEKGR